MRRRNISRHGNPRGEAAGSIVKIYVGYKKKPHCQSGMVFCYIKYSFDFATYGKNGIKKFKNGIKKLDSSNSNQ